MVITKVMGGLGNQMFQFAAGYAASKQLKTQLFLDLSWFDQSLNNTNVTQREFQLDKFELNYHLLKDKNIIDKNDKVRSKYIRNIYSILGRSINKVIEKPIEFTPIFSRKNQHLYLDGYWQSHKYFINYEQDVRSLFLKPIDHLNSINKEISQRIQQKNSIALHIRRGDYVTNQHANSFHGLCSINYYHNAIEYLYNNNYLSHDSEFFIFSDDIDWVKENLKVDYNTHYVNHNSSEQAHFDLLLMSQCSHHILANSSFSWWGAYLSNSNGKKIAPKLWYAKSKKDISYMFPNTWIRL